MRFKVTLYLEHLFKAYRQSPKLMPAKYLDLSDKYGQERAICDYIAGMTDRYAIEEYEKLYGPVWRM